MKYIYFTFLIIALMSCQQEAEEAQAEQQIQAVEIPLKADLEDDWANLINNNLEALANSYTESAVKVDKNGDFLNGQKEIVQDYQKNRFEITSFEQIKTVFAGQEDNFEYEISQFETTEEQIMKQVVIWDLSEKPKKRTFEFIAKANHTKEATAALDERRNKWIHLCNKHNAKALIEEMYTKNTVYYNHKPVIVGHEDLAVEYQYMNNESYELFLEPIIVETVQDDLVYEIGQCSGSYGGKYILIWQKGEDDIWRILVDSNI